MPLQELQIYALWMGKQTAKGTKNAAPAKRFKQVGGGFTSPRDDGSQAFSDATQNVDTLDWVDRLMGAGSPALHATPEEMAWLIWAFQGGETTRAITGPPAKTQHILVALPGLGHWITAVQRVGSQLVDRKSFNDCQIAQLTIEGSTANKDVRITPQVVSLDPGENIAADPAAVMPTKRPFLYTDAVGRWSLDATIVRGHSQFTVTINKDLQPIPGDDVYMYDLAIGQPVVTVGCTLYFDTEGRAFWNRQIYGDPAPAAGTKPLSTLPALGAYGVTMSLRDAAGAATGDKFVLDIPGVKWNIPPAPEPNPAGGAGQLAIAGAMRKVAGRADYTISIDCDAAAFTV